MSKLMSISRYVWCFQCDTFAHFFIPDHSEEHDKALNGKCPSCGSDDIASLPQLYHERRLIKVATRGVAS